MEKRKDSVNNLPESLPGLVLGVLGRNCFEASEE